jgi:AcrR family transcriptional regulator
MLVPLTLNIFGVSVVNVKSDVGKRPYLQGARAEAAEATQDRIVEAFLAQLMTHWFDEITLDRVAHDAGVTVQTVVRRCGSKDGLLALSLRRLAAQINAQRQVTPGDVDTIVERLVEDYDVTGDAVIRLLAVEPRHPALHELLNFGRSEHRRWVVGAFPKADGAVLDGLIVITDVYTWKLLRRDMGHSAAATKAILNTLVKTIYHQEVA